MKTNLTLLSFGKTLPVSSSETLLKLMVKYSRESNFDIFLINLIEILDLSKISSLDLLLKLSLLTDGTDLIRNTALNAMNMINILISTPDLYEDMTKEQLCGKLSDFILNLDLSDQINQQWLSALSAVVYENQQENMFVFTNILQKLVTKFASKKIDNCIPTLSKIKDLLSVYSIRLSFCFSPHFKQTLRILLSKSFYPMDEPEIFAKYFGNNVPSSITDEGLQSFDKVIALYHDLLQDIFRKFITTKTKDKMFDFIKEFISFAETHLSPSNPVPESVMVCYNFECVLIRLAVILKNKWNEVNPLTPYLKNTIAPIGSYPALAIRGDQYWVDITNKEKIDNLNQTSSSSNAISEEEKNEWFELVNSNNEKDPSIVSEFFFCSLKALTCVSINIMKMMEQINRIVFLDIEPVIRDPKTPEDIRKEKIRIKENFARMYFFADNLLLSKSSVDNKVSLIFGAFEFLISNLSPEEYPPIIYQHIPEYVFSGPIRFLNCLMRANVIGNKLNDYLINMITKLFSNRNYIPNPTLAFEIVQFYSSILFDKKINYLLLITSVIEKAFPSVIDFYSRCEATGTHSEYSDKYKFRPNCVKLLNYWLQFPECLNYFVNNSNNESISLFVYYLFKDCTDYINKFHEDIVTQSNKLYDLDYNDMKNSLLLLNKIAEAKSMLFEDKKFVSLPSMFYFSLQKYFDLYPMTLKIHFNEFDPEFLFINLIKLVGSFKGNEIILKYFKDPAYGYNTDIIHLSIGKLDNFKNNYEFYLIKNNFMEFICNLNNINLEFDIPQEIIENAPSDYLDPITYELLYDPVMLSTGLIINNSTYLQNLSLFGNKDPLTQMPFDPDKTKELPELKKKILDWVKEQKEKKN